MSRRSKTELFKFEVKFIYIGKFTGEKQSNLSLT